MQTIKEILYRTTVGLLVLGIAAEALIGTYYSYNWLHRWQLDVPLGVAIVVFAAVYIIGTLFVYLTTGETPD